MIKAEIITIGDEILIGQIVDTNSAWMGQQLNGIGIAVHQITSISDNKEHIVSALDAALLRADVVLLTGGLGPTKDDITKTTLADFFQTGLIQSETVLAHIQAMTASRGFTMNQLNIDQALVPENCTVLNNPNGTAPGMLFSFDGKFIVSMPGVPFEMKPLMTDHVLPFLKEQFKLPHIIHKTIIVQGFSESHLSVVLNDWEDQLPEIIKLAYLPSPGRIRMRFSLTGFDKVYMQQSLDKALKELSLIIPHAISSYNEEGIDEVVGQLLNAKHATMACAESCTGGSIASLITSRAGSSSFFKGGVVAYANEIKQQALGVNPDSLEKFGAVSQQVVEEMAIGCIQTMGVDYAVATSGIAGPDGGTDEKPVGTIWIAAASRNKVVSKLYTMGNHRHININKSVQTALKMLRELLLEE